MLKLKQKRRAQSNMVATKHLAQVRASVTALDDEDLLDIADIFRDKPGTSLAQWTAAEMTRRRISL